MHALANKGGKVSSGLTFDVAYRFLDINDVGGLGPAGEATLDDLDALTLGVGVYLGF